MGLAFSLTGEIHTPHGCIYLSADAVTIDSRGKGQLHFLALGAYGKLPTCIVAIHRSSAKIRLPRLTVEGAAESTGIFLQGQCRGLSVGLGLGLDLGLIIVLMTPPRPPLVHAL